MEPEREGRRERLPEQLFSTFSKPEPEMLHPELYGQLIDRGTDVILEHLKRYSEDRRRLLDKVKGRIKLEQASEKWDGAEKLLTVASDAGNNGADLRSAFAPLYAAVAVAARGWRLVGEPICLAGEPEVWVDEFATSERESLLAAKLQFEVSLKGARKWRPRVVVMDGTLLLNFSLLPAAEATEDYKRDFKEAVGSAVKLLHECKEAKVLVVGFVKRTRANSLCGKLGAPHLRDTALLDLVLERGQYTLPEEPMENPVVDRYRRFAKEELGLKGEEVKEVCDIYSCYIRTGYQTPYRLEVPRYCLDRLGLVANLLYATSEEDGIPFCVYEADKLTKITAAISNVRTL
ncbi:TPA: DNA double-strand break repair nuclease NurA, partial [Candidatus Bathyarchaeota archaeon]|nr:DNA double-strand break repair nuclease NurA [Candidatus Bathyarchaeota archaeon]